MLLPDTGAVGTDSACISVPVSTDFAAATGHPQLGAKPIKDAGKATQRLTGTREDATQAMCSQVMLPFPKEKSPLNRKLAHVQVKNVFFFR